MSKKTITVENCREKTNELMASLGEKDKDASQNAAWVIVLHFCQENGMRNNRFSGIESVIRFIDAKIKLAKKKN